jgi:hypothetical protein
MHSHSAARSTLLLSAALVLGACGGLARSGGSVPVDSAPGESAPNSGSLVVENRTSSEVVVYAVLNARSGGFRLGNVNSFTTATINVPLSALQGGDLVVRLHAIAGTRDWISPRITLNEDLVARLDIRADGRGDMSQSALYTLPPPLSGNRL